MKAFYKYLTKKRKSFHTLVLDFKPIFDIVTVDIDQDGNTMGVEVIL